MIPPIYRNLFLTNSIAAGWPYTLAACSRALRASVSRCMPSAAAHCSPLRRKCRRALPGLFFGLRASLCACSRALRASVSRCGGCATCGFPPPRAGLRAVLRPCARPRFGPSALLRPPPRFGVTLRVGRMAGSLSPDCVKNAAPGWARRLFFHLRPALAPLCAYPPRFGVSLPL